MTPPFPTRVTRQQGRVFRAVYGKGSKSEREAVFIEIAGEPYLLRRKEGPALADPSLEPLVGHEIECDGFIVGSTLIADRIEILDGG